MHDAAGAPVRVGGGAGPAIGLGTYLGGRRIIRTMGEVLTEIQDPAGLRRRDRVHHGHPHLGPPRRPWGSPRRECASWPARQVVAYGIWLFVPQFH